MSAERPRATSAGQRMPLARHRMQRSDFARAYGEGRRAKGPGLSVVVRENGLDRARLGLSVSKKIARKAVHRNRVRRIFREAFRLSLAELPPGIDVVMIATEPGLRPRLADTRAALVELVARALRKPPRAPRP